MTENEVNKKCKTWLEKRNYSYKGILNAGKGEVPVPDGKNQVYIDHQGINNFTKDLIWIEAKGQDDNISELLQGFIRVLYACYHGGGKGLLAIPDTEYQKLLEQKDFLAKVARAGERQVGLLNVEKEETEWLI